MRILHWLILGAACGSSVLNSEIANAEVPTANVAPENQPNHQLLAPGGAQSPALAPTPSAETPARPAPAAPSQPAPPTATPAPSTATPLPEQRYIIVDPSTGSTGAVLLLPVAPPRPATLPYVEGAPIPQGYRLDEYHPKGLIISGAVTLGVLYVLAFTLADGGQSEGADPWLAVPVVGPFVWAATRKDPPPCSSSSLGYPCSSGSDNRTAAILDGLGQGLGAALLTAGLVITRKRLVLTEPDVVVAPYATSHGSGLSLVGRF